MPVALQPENLRELSEALASANTRGETIALIDLRQLSRVLEYAPEDMTVTVEAGITLASLQALLAAQRQWLPIDPPQPERATIGGILDSNASGPRRFGYGTVRDWLIGLRVALADGTAIKSGGRVVKNVAGYDLAKLFIGSHGTLGVIVEATFKLRPLPESEAFVQRAFIQLEEATQFVEHVLEGKLNPVVMDLHNLSLHNVKSLNGFTVVLGFAGAREDVDYELKQAAECGLHKGTGLRYEAAFWSSQSTEPARKQSVLPSNLGRTLKELGNVPFVARAGNGIVYYRGGPMPTPADATLHLFKRIKDAFDPKHTFPILSE